MTNKRRIAYSGAEGAFAHIAAVRIFPNDEKVSCPDFQAAYEAVQNGDCDACVLPIENSYAGEVGQVMDLLFSGPLRVTALYTLPVRHCLLGVPGAKLQDIRTVLSHQQALSQCAGFIRSHGFEPRAAVNTALAAREIAQKGDPAAAAIASRSTASIYGLDILASDIHESAENATRFAVFVKEAPQTVRDDRMILLFTVKNTAGTLAAAINVIGQFGFNMRVLRSRPMKSLPWEYYFYAELEKCEGCGTLRDMLDALDSKCTFVKVDCCGPDMILSD